MKIYNFDFGCASKARSSRRKILPLTFFGISSINRTPPRKRFADETRSIRVKFKIIKILRLILIIKLY